MASMDHQPPPKRAKVEEEAVEEALAVRQDSRGVKAAAADAAAEQAEELGAALPNATIDRMYLWRVPKLSDSASPGCQSKSVPNTAGWGQTTAFAADAPDPAPVPRAGYNQLLGDDNVIVADIVRKPYASASDSGESRAFLRAGPRHTLHFDPKDDLAAAIVTCGGLCPGLNNVIRELTVRPHFRPSGLQAKRLLGRS